MLLSLARAFSKASKVNWYNIGLPPFSTINPAEVSSIRSIPLAEADIFSSNELSRFSEAVKMNYDIDAECYEFKLCDSSPIRQVGIFLKKNWINRYYFFF